MSLSVPAAPSRLAKAFAPLGIETLTMFTTPYFAWFGGIGVGAAVFGWWYKRQNHHDPAYVNLAKYVAIGCSIAFVPSFVLYFLNDGIRETLLRWQGSNVGCEQALLDWFGTYTSWSNSWWWNPLGISINTQKANRLAEILSLCGAQYTVDVLEAAYNYSTGTPISWRRQVDLILTNPRPCQVVQNP